MREALAEKSVFELYHDDWLEQVDSDALADLIVCGMSSDEIEDALTALDPPPTLCGGVTDPAKEKALYDRAMRGE